MMRKPEKGKNVGRLARRARVIAGAITTFIGLAYLLSAGSAVAVVFGVVFVLLGVEFVYAGITGYSPLYNKLGRSTVRRSGSGDRTSS